MKEEYISDLMLERYLLRELPEKHILHIKKLCEQMPDLQARIDALKKSNEEILNEYPENMIISEINRKSALLKSELKNKTAAVKTPFQKRLLLPSFALATAIISLVFIIPVVRTSLFFSPIENGTRIKGDDSKIFIYRKTGNSAELLQNNSNAKNGDLLQIAYTSIKDKYGIILSIDGRGTVTLHFPLDFTSLSDITTGNKVLLPNSYELDDAPDFEKFFFITSEKPMDIKFIFQAAEKISNDENKVLNENTRIVDKDNSINQVSVLIKKVK